MSAFRFTRHEKGVFGSHVQTKRLLHRLLTPLNGLRSNWAWPGFPGTGVFSLLLTSLSSLTSAHAKTLAPRSHGASARTHPFATRSTVFCRPPRAAPG